MHMSVCTCVFKQGTGDLSPDSHLHLTEHALHPFCKCVKRSIGVSLCFLSVSDPQYLFCGQRKRSRAHALMVTLSPSCRLTVTLSPTRPGLKDSE